MKFTDFLKETDDKSAKADAVRAKLKQAEADLKDMSVTPHSQEAADAIDDAREDVKRLKKELASLTENFGYDAKAAYANHLEQFNQNLDILRSLVDRHSMRQNASGSWGFVGNLAEANERLKELIEFFKEPSQDK
jgi:uncharacterized protein YukE